MSGRYLVYGRGNRRSGGGAGADATRAGRRRPPMTPAPRRCARIADELGVELVVAPEPTSSPRSSSAATWWSRRRAFPRRTRCSRSPVAAGRPVRSELELAYRWEQERAGGPRPMLAVTGTDGKTTVTLWATEMLRAGGVRRWPPATRTCRWSPRSTSTSMRSSSSARASGWRRPSSSAARPRCGSTSPRITSTGTPRWRPTRRPRRGCSRSNGPRTRRSARSPIPS